jgi:hypothetical protein
VLGIVAALVVAIAAGTWWWRDHLQHEADAAAHEREAAADKESKLAAELKAAQSALAQAEAAKRQAEEEKTKHDAAEREAALAAELKVAKDALAKSAAPVARAAAAPAKPAATADQYDGLYRGRVCKAVKDAAIRCWTALLTAQHGAATASWINRASGNTSHASGTIAADGAVSIDIDAFDAQGKAVSGKMTGRVADKAITLSGNWSDGTAGNASLAWAPDAAPLAVKSRTGKSGER